MTNLFKPFDDLTHNRIRQIIRENFTLIMSGDNTVFTADLEKLIGPFSIHCDITNKISVEIRTADRRAFIKF